MPNKAVAASLAGGVAIIIAWALNQFGHVQLPQEVVAALTTILTAGATYFTPHEGNAQG